MRDSISGLLRRPQLGASNPFWTSMISNAACRENVCMYIGTSPVCTAGFVDAPYARRSGVPKWRSVRSVKSMDEAHS